MLQTTDRRIAAFSICRFDSQGFPVSPGQDFYQTCTHTKVSLRFFRALRSLEHLPLKVHFLLFTKVRLLCQVPLSQYMFPFDHTNGICSSHLRLQERCPLWFVNRVSNSQWASQLPFGIATNLIPIVTILDRQEALRASLWLQKRCQHCTRLRSHLLVARTVAYQRMAQEPIWNPER